MFHGSSFQSFCVGKNVSYYASILLFLLEIMLFEQYQVPEKFPAEFLVMRIFKQQPLALGQETTAVISAVSCVKIRNIPFLKNPNKVSILYS